MYEIFFILVGHILTIIIGCMIYTLLKAYKDNCLKINLMEDEIRSLQNEKEVWQIAVKNTLPKIDEIYDFIKNLEEDKK